MKNRRTRKLFNYLVINDDNPHGIIVSTAAEANKFKHPKTVRSFDARYTEGFQKAIDQDKANWNKSN